jgi:Tol biopolymer transport system component
MEVPIMKKKSYRILILLGSMVAAMTWLVITQITLATVTSTNGNLYRVTTASPAPRDSRAPDVSGNSRFIAFYSESDFLGQGIPTNYDEIWLYDRFQDALTRITTGSGLGLGSQYPSLNYDGQYIAFHSDSDFFNQGDINEAQFEIWLFDTTTLTGTRITTASDTDRDSQYPRISGNGQKIVFVSDSHFSGAPIPDDQYEIWLYDTAVMSLTRVTTASDSNRDSFAPKISLDGTKIVFYSDSDFLGQGIPDEQYEVWLYDTTAMSLTRITTASDANRGNFQATISGDGQTIAFYSDSDYQGQGIPDDQYEVWLYNTTTMSLTRVTTASDPERDTLWVRLSGNGKQLSLIGDSDFLNQGVPNDQFEVWLYDTTTLTYTRVTTATHSDRDSSFASLSADGKTLAFHSDSDFWGQGIAGGQQEIWLLDDHVQLYIPIIVKDG